jgi:hypothetical protein
MPEVRWSFSFNPKSGFGIGVWRRVYSAEETIWTLALGPLNWFLRFF